LSFWPVGTPNVEVKMSSSLACWPLGSVAPHSAGGLPAVAVPGQTNSDHHGRDSNRSDAIQADAPEPGRTRNRRPVRADRPVRQDRDGADDQSFLRVVIAMYFDDHAPPHFHARHAEGAAKVRIDTLEPIESTLGRRQLRFVFIRPSFIRPSSLRTGDSREMVRH